MPELHPEYLNKLASQVIMTSSLLSGFSIAEMLNILVNKYEKKPPTLYLKSQQLHLLHF